MIQTSLKINFRTVHRSRDWINSVIIFILKNELKNKYLIETGIKSASLGTPLEAAGNISYLTSRKMQMFSLKSNSALT